MKLAAGGALPDPAAKIFSTTSECNGWRLLDFCA
jgi:hypothetical protein